MAEGSENESSESGGFRIGAIWAYLAVDDDGDEGVMAMRGPDGDWMPMIAGDEKRRDLFRPIAEQQARMAGMEVRLVRFHQREEVETIE